MALALPSLAAPDSARRRKTSTTASPLRWASTRSIRSAFTSRGLSCGANATWNYPGDHVTEKVAAVVTIAGDARGALKKQGCKLGAMLIWAFHGLADIAENPSWEVVPINSLNMCSPAPVDAKVTTYPGVPHDAWTMTYDLSNPANDIYAWMMKYTHQ